MTPRRIAVVGAGMAAARFARRLHELAAPGTVDVVLHGAEPDRPYHRGLLPALLAGGYADACLALPTGAATVHTATPVLALDPVARVLRTTAGATPAYDAVVLATGAEPILPPLHDLYRPPPRPVPAMATASASLAARNGAGTGTLVAPAARHDAPPALKAGVHLLRTLADCRHLAAEALPGRTAVVVGGGALGTGTAHALGARGLRVQLVQRAPHLIPRHLDAPGAATVRRHLEAGGVRVHTGRTATALTGPDHVTGVRLDDGQVLPAELVLLACGARPRTALARAAGLAVRTGVVVDDRLATSAPGVYALGDCAEHRGTTDAGAETAFAQADVLAARLSGHDPAARLTAVPTARFRLSTAGGELDVASFGDPHGDAPHTDTVRLTDATRGTYRKLVLRGDALVGAVLVGDLGAVGELAGAFERGESAPPDPLQLLITEGAPS
ncbi:FAD-dependent oxidoreductase [Streptomyces sp. NPDC049585]|uniref:NAD(P)/FAD-dependent oxidoreductase n=1 Tax=Streptomyces sp. NPDC049585 TaxID=3155154 RepID=UPI003419E86C